MSEPIDVTCSRYNIEIGKEVYYIYEYYTDNSRF